MELSLLTHLPEDMIFVIKSYLPLEEIRRQSIYKKYYNLCYTALHKFTVIEINTYFHKEDYFSIDLNKKVTINNYISVNLKKNNWDNESYQHLKKLIVCSQIKSAIVKLNKKNI
jgi:hypothetical protein